MRIILTFIFIPLITSIFGEAKYGVWVIIFQIISYFAVFDFGFLTALTRYISKYLAKNQFNLINITINTINVIYTAIGLSVFGLVYLFNKFFFHYLKIDDPALVLEGKEALMIMGGFMALNFIFRAYGGSLVCFQREDINRQLIVVEEILRYTTLIILLKMGYGLPALAWAVLVLSSLRYLISMVILKSLFKPLRFSPSLYENDSFKKLLDYSSVSFAINIGWLIMFSSDNFLLGMMSSAAMAGIYAPGAQLMLYFRNIVNNIGIPLIPAISHLEAKQDYERIKKIYYKNIKYTTLISAALIGGTYFYAKPFVALWLSDIYEPTANVIIILSLGTAFFVPHILNNSILFGIGKHKFIMFTLIFEASGKLILAYIFVNQMGLGLTGMAWSNSIVQIAFYSTLYPYLFKKALNISLKTTLITGLKSFGLGAVVLFPLGYFLPQTIIPVSWLGLGINLFIFMSIVLALVFIVLEKDDREMIKNFFIKKRPA